MTYMTSTIVVSVILTSVTGMACFTDLRTGLIPNRRTLPVLALAPLAQAFLGGWPGLGASLLGLLVCAVIPLVFFAIGAMGGGDVKLFAAIGAVAGVSLGLEVEFLSLCTAFVWGMGVAAYRGQLWRLLGNSLWTFVNPLLPVARRRTSERSELTTIRIGGAILAGTVLALAGQAFAGQAFAGQAFAGSGGL
jgi:prepilin peptidase CpaA